MKIIMICLAAFLCGPSIWAQQKKKPYSKKKHRTVVVKKKKSVTQLPPPAEGPYPAPVGVAPPDDVYDTVEEPPEFPGGTRALYTFLGKHISYPPEAIEAGIEGTVYLRFIIDENGMVTYVNIAKDIGGGCGKEAVRVVKSLPRWKAARRQGRRVKTYYMLPVTFQFGE